jgi:hypothetical protein
MFLGGPKQLIPMLLKTKHRLPTLLKTQRRDLSLIQYPRLVKRVVSNVMQTMTVVNPCSVNRDHSLISVRGSAAIAATEEAVVRRCDESLGKLVVHLESSFVSRNRGNAYVLVQLKLN